MLNLFPFAKFLLLISISSLIFSCNSNDAEYTFNKKPVSSVESKDGNVVVVHFRDNTTQSFSAAQVEKMLKEKNIEENVYQLFAQKIKEAQAKQSKLAGKAEKEKYPYKLNGRDVHYVELKNGVFTIHLADKTSQSFSQHEIDCMLINHIIPVETFLLCMQKQNEVSAATDSGLFSFSYRELKCPEFN